MRKPASVVISPIISVLFLWTLSSPAHALDVSIGPAVWYAWWTPAFWKEWKKSSHNEPGESYLDSDINSTFMVGPAFALSFSPKWSLTGVLMWTRWYKAEKNGLDNFGAERTEDRFDITKYDLDVAVNYAVSGSIKVFAGAKYQGYVYQTRDRNIDIASGLVVDESSGRIGWRSIGPGLGIGVSLPLGDSLFLLCNVSGIVMYSTLDTTFDEKQSWAYISYGANGSLSLAWYVDSITTTLSVGARYQYLYNDNYAAKSDSLGDNNPGSGWDKTADRFYGLTFSAVYSFEL
ncbi:MAG: hypothetical protein QM472_11380 [Spirochaetota bacterium]|nr:hypothetical protein [Spirochaetota bacterium]